MPSAISVLLLTGLIGLQLQGPAPATNSVNPTATKPADSTLVASEQNPTSAPASQPKAQVQLALRPVFGQVADLIRARATDPARDLLHQYLNRNPNDGQATFLLGLTYHREQRYGQSKAYFEEALQLEPGFGLTHYFLAWSLFNLGDLPNAREHFEIFQKLKPDEADVSFGLGLIDLDEGKLEDAERQFNRSIELCQANPARPDRKGLSKAYTRLAEVYERNDRSYEAKAALIRATEIFPDHYEAYYRLSQLLMRMGETDAANKARRSYLEHKEKLHPGSTSGETVDRPDTTEAVENK
jgi:tetratricopeptide (TPR) repeat protein